MYIDGMIWDINAIHTAYPDFLSNNIRASIFRIKNPFIRISCKSRFTSRKKAGYRRRPCIVIQLLVCLLEGASLNTLDIFGNPNNLLILSCSSGTSSLGRKIARWRKICTIEAERGMQEIKVNMRVELVKWIVSTFRKKMSSFLFSNNMYPKPKRILVITGEGLKSLDLASSLYKN